MERPSVAMGVALATAVVLVATAGLSYFDFYHRDVSWSLYVAGKMLDGAQLYRDVLDENPPWLYWLSMLPVAVSRLLGAEPNAVYNAFVVLLSAASVALIYTLLRRGWPEVDASLRVTLCTLAGSAFVLLPGSEFGQRENILAAMVLPYLFSGASWLRGRPLSPGLSVAVGLFASIGLLFKPHFYLLCLFVEVLLLWEGRGRGSWKRPEAWTIGGIAVLYAASVPLVYPHYFDMVAIALEYYDGYGDPWSPWVLVAPGVGWALAAAALCGLFRSTTMNRELRRVALAGIAGLTLAGFLQFKGWYYHYDGARLIAAVLIGLVLIGPLVRPGGLEQVVRARAAQIPLITLALLLAWGLFRLGVVAEGRLGGRQTGPTIFEELTQVVKEHAGTQPFFVLTTSAFPSFPLVSATRAQWPTRHWALWLLPGLYSPEEKLADPFPYRTREEMSEYERWFIDTLVDDLLAAPPALLIVDRTPTKQGFVNSSIDFLSYMSRDPRFARDFEEFERLTDIGGYRVYKRIRPTQ